MQSKLQEVQLAREQLQSEYDKLKADESDKAAKLKDMSSVLDKREQAKQDLKGTYALKSCIIIIVISL